jgi:hypothetical protein
MDAPDYEEGNYIHNELVTGQMDAQLSGYEMRKSVLYFSSTI